MHPIFEKICLKICGREKAIELFRKRGVQIGDRCDIDPATNFGTEPYLISIGNHVRITGDVSFFTHDGGLWVVRELRKEYRNCDKLGKITVGDNVSIGWGVTILPGVHIGNNVVIGAGAIVTKDIPDNSVAVGIPARVIETIEEYIEKNKGDYLFTSDLKSDQKRKIVEAKFVD